MSLAGDSPASDAAAAPFLPAIGNSSTAPLLSSPGNLYAISTCRSALVVASGWRTPASAPGRFSISRRQSVITFTVKAMTLSPFDPLLLRQRDERADTRRAARRSEAGDERNEREDGNSGQHHHRVERTDAVQLGSDDVAQRQRARDARGNAERYQQRAFTQHEPQDTPRVAAERQPNADFARTLADVIREHAVQTDRREQQGEQAERRGEEHRRAPGIERLLDP